MSQAAKGTTAPKRTRPKARSRIEENPDQLELGEKPVEQVELFDDQPGGRQSATRLNLNPRRHGSD